MYGAVRKSYRNFDPTNPVMALPSSWIEAYCKLDFDQSLFCPKICERVRYINTHIYNAIAHRFSSKSKTARSLDLDPTFLRLKAQYCETFVCMTVPARMFDQWQEGIV